MIAVMTIFQIILMAVVMIKSWVSMASPFAQWFNIGWGATYLLTVFFCFFILLNVDKCTRFPLFSSRIWALPGRLAFYIYMLHFPIIILCGMALGFKGVVLGPENAPVLVPKIILNFVIALIISILAAIVVMLVDTKLIRPWLAGSPWFSKEPEEAGVEIKADKE
jgi:peptidoglycan/LPS O-acetylase OafA/YrhL